MSFDLQKKNPPNPPTYFYTQVLEVVRKDNSLLRSEVSDLHKELQEIKQLLRASTGAAAPAVEAVVVSGGNVPKEADTGEIHVDSG